jgi:endonuclease/exonuclease/phosphatase family metal-dependent hydrolase
MRFTAISWNLFHGRDFPPDPALFTWRSRLLRISERNQTHLQVNRELRAEFAALLAGAEWDVALLQECPPRFREALVGASGAEAPMVLTSRNSLGRLRGWAATVNPDLMASGEGGSNLTLVRRGSGLGPIVERRRMAIHEGRPERRAMGFVRTGAGLCVANLHATNDIPRLAAEDVMRAAEAAVGWAGDAPLLFGGDLNLRPAQDPAPFQELEERFGLRGVTRPHAIDHLLARGLEVVSPSRQWPPERREVAGPGGLAIRLSDHAPVEASYSAGDGPADEA